MKLKRPIRIGAKGGDVLAVERALRKWAGLTSPKPDGEYEQRDSDRCMAFQAEQEIKPASGAVGQRTLDALWPYMDVYGKMRYRLYRAPNPVPGKWEDIGPVQPGGRSLLDQSLTHDTSGIPLFPAVDTAWGGGGGVTVIAPEDCVVDTKDTSAGPGEAVYLTGVSELRHWVGHLDRDWPLGRKFKKGDVIGKTLPIPGSSDHAHWGVNVEAILGKGKELKWGRNGNGPRYTLGAPTVGTQLERALT